MSTNGRLAPSELTVVQGTMRLATATALAWGLLVADAVAETGRTPRISPDGAYRSFADQERLSGTGNHQYRPGYSVHGLGRCVDIGNWQDFGYVGVRPTWYSPALDRLAERYGFRRTIGTEPWHYQHNGLVPIASTLNRKDRPMYIRRLSTGTIAKFGEGHYVEFASPAEYAAHRGILAAYNGLPQNAGDQQFVPPAALADVMGVDEAGWAVMVKFHRADDLDLDLVIDYEELAENLAAHLDIPTPAENAAALGAAIANG